MPRTAARAADTGTVLALLRRPLLDLVHEAACVHRAHHDARRVQCSELLSIKTGGCSEDCGYCAQSARHAGAVESKPLTSVADVAAAARAAKDAGADRFCMGAAWRAARTGAEFERVLAMVREVKALGLESCATLGALDTEQARRLAEAGLDYYNHNLDTSRERYGGLVTTHDYDDRLATLRAARDAGLRLCCGGILGLGEDERDRAAWLAELAALQPPPESVPINVLVPIAGTPLAESTPIDWTEVVRAVAAARILLPRSDIRLAAGRAELDEASQALCFLAGANSIFVGATLLTTPNGEPGRDAQLLDKLGLRSVSDSK